MLAITRNHIPNVVTTCPPDLRVFRGGLFGTQCAYSAKCGDVPTEMHHDDFELYHPNGW